MSVSQFNIILIFISEAKKLLVELTNLAGADHSLNPKDDEMRIDDDGSIGKGLAYYIKADP